VLPLQLSDTSGVPFYRQLVDQFAELVGSGTLAPGDPLPSVRKLSGQLFVSLITVRRAYAELQHAGLVVRRQGQGTFVAEGVAQASAAQARAEAEATLRAAVTKARQLGMHDREQAALCATLWEVE